jgi:hypothetical protein
MLHLAVKELSGVDILQWVCYRFCVLLDHIMVISLLLLGYAHGQAVP